MARPRSVTAHLDLPPGINIIKGRYYYRPTRLGIMERKSIPLGPIGCSKQELWRKWAEASAECPPLHQPVKEYSSTIEGSVVYFIRSGRHGPIKIGVSDSVAGANARLAALQTGSPWELSMIGLVPGTREDEQRAHRLLRHHRLNGEWFKPASPVSSFIREAITSRAIPLAC